MDPNEYSVYQFFEDDTYQCVRHRVSADEAGEALDHYCLSASAQLGTTKRVIVVDGSDSICLEWVYGKGVVFPTEEYLKSIKPRI